MKVIKRNGKEELVNLNKITERLRVLIDLSPKLSIDPIVIATKVVSGLYDKVTTRELDNLAAETAASMASIHPDYDTLAARLIISGLHKETSDDFAEVTKKLEDIGIIDKEYAKYIYDNRTELNAIIDYSRDYSFDYFGVQTLKRSYLLKTKNKAIVERPQHLWMRVASFLHRGSLEKIKETYDLLSLKYFTHATPTLFNAGTIRPQLSSCFLLDVDGDSIEGIYKTLADCAKISQSAGGIGLAIHKIRSTGSYIHGTNGHSNGIVPMLRVFNETARYVDQGGGKRKGSIAIYLEPWHADIFDFLDLKKNHGKEELRARDLFYGLWIPDLFMKRVENDENFTLFDPAEAYVLDSKGNREYLYETHGASFERLYTTLESEGKGKTIKARELWDKILVTQIETGVPYLLYKDAANAKSNQQNLGTIKSSNLCVEIIEYTSPEEVAVCNLASLSLPAFIKDGDVDYDKLYKVTRVVTNNLNKVIDLNYYPVPEAKNSNLKHRPIGIGVQGLADLFAKLKLAFDDNRAKELNRKIFECIYHAAIDESINISASTGPYRSYNGSPAANGKLQFDLWGIDRTTLHRDWANTFKNLGTYGLRNSLLVAPMPTASTSQILGNTECFEPITSNLYTRRTLAGEFIVPNKHLLNELIELGIWNEKLRQKLIAANGSVQNLLEIPADVRHRYRTVWEMRMRDIIDMAADRGPFICQSQSLNLFLSEPSVSKLTSMHFYAWKKGLKTGCYYLRTEAARDAIKFTLDKELINGEEVSKTLETSEDETIGKVCSIDDPNCESCSG
jgi:ribonucleoside-diphosphate reductase alpha chain